MDKLVKAIQISQGATPGDEKLTNDERLLRYAQQFDARMTNFRRSNAPEWQAFVKSFNLQDVTDPRKIRKRMVMQAKKYATYRAIAEGLVTVRKKK